MDRKNLEQIETGIWRDRSTKELLSVTKVEMSGKFEKVRRVWPAGKEALRAARLWRETVKTQYKAKHSTMKLRTNGTWLVKLPSTTKYQAQVRNFGYNFSEAFDWATTSYPKRLKGSWIDESTTVADIWASYLESTKRPKPATLIEYKRIWTKDLADYWGSIVATEVGAKRVQKWIDSWTSTVPKLHHAHRVLSVILSHAVDEEVLPHNPAFRRKLPTVKKPAAPAFNDAQLNTLVNHPKRYSDRLGMALGLQTGLRISEWTPLTVKDVDCVKRQVTVSQHLTRVKAGGKRELEAGHKTGRDSKTAGISSELAEAIAKFVLENGLGQNDLLFPAPKGGMHDYNNFRDRVWEPARKAAAIEHVPYMTGTHSLKRTAVTVAFEGGLSAATIKGQTKHSGTKIILETYVQTSSDAEQKVASVIQERLGLPREAA